MFMNYFNRILYLGFLMVSYGWVSAQNVDTLGKPPRTYVYQTFKDTRIINSYGLETLQKGLLEIRIAHRFGDFFNQWQFNNAWADFIGLENAADIGIGVEYGITNNLMVGIHRTKGANRLNSLVHGLAKYKLVAQTTDNSMPFTLTAAATATVVTAPPSADLNAIGSFPGGFGQRWMYSAQLIAGRKFSDRFSLQISPTFIWRNLVEYYDNNYLFSTGISAKVQITKGFGLILDATIPFDGNRLSGGAAAQGAHPYYIPIGIGFEFDTGGHVFQVNLTNARGIEPVDYIPNSSSNWVDGQFRIGFAIARAFRINR